MLLLMLNCGLHPGELAGLRLTDIDLRKRHLWDHRNKTTCQRCSILWKRTVDAIRAYQKAEPHGSDFLFVNYQGNGYSSGGLAEYFAKYIRPKAKLSDSVELDQIRKGATHAASKYGADSDHVKMFLGHDRGDLDAYDERMPSKTKDVVDAIEAAFFGGRK